MTLIASPNITSVTREGVEEEFVVSGSLFSGNWLPLGERDVRALVIHAGKLSAYWEDRPVLDVESGLLLAPWVVAINDRIVGAIATEYHEREACGEYFCTICALGFESAASRLAGRAVTLDAALTLIRREIDSLALIHLSLDLDAERRSNAIARKRSHQTLVQLLQATWSHL